MKKRLVTAGIAALVGVTGLTGAAVASAATDTSSTNPMSNLVEAIATKFNLKQTDVQAVVDAERAEMRASRESEVKAEIAQLVADGKLTQAQADKINAKRAELQKEHQAVRAAATQATRDERRAKMEAHRTELEAWAKENGIDTTYLKYVMGGDRGHRHGGPAGV